MAEHTRPKLVENVEKYHTCDICHEEINAGSRRTCALCGRDVHPAGHTDPQRCSEHDNDDFGGTICLVCFKLGGAHCALVQEQIEEFDKSFAEWRAKCQEHQHDGR